MEINDAIELFIQFKLVEEGLNQNSTIPSYKEDLKVLEDVDGILVPGGFGKDGTEGQVN